MLPSALFLVAFAFLLACIGFLPLPSNPGRALGALGYLNNCMLVRQISHIDSLIK
jgi:hypothetical protein